MTREELIAHLEHLAEYVKYSEDAPALREAIALLKTHEKRTETHACDLIRRADVEQTVEDNILCYTHSDRPIDQDPDTECHKAIRTALKMLRKDLRNLSPAQPDHSADVSKKVDSDLISRREVIDEIEYELEMINLALDSITLDFNTRERLRQRKGEAREILNSIQQLPPAQPESIKCKDCGYAEERGCALFCGFWTRYTAHKGHCFKAERREDG